MAISSNFCRLQAEKRSGSRHVLLQLMLSLLCNSTSLNRQTMIILHGSWNSKIFIHQIW